VHHYVKKTSPRSSTICNSAVSTLHSGAAAPFTKLFIAAYMAGSRSTDARTSIGSVDELLGPVC
jgi:hypothetical protein